MKISNKMIEKNRIISSDVHTIWEKWTTKEGLNSFFSVDNRIELRPMGKFEIYFSMEVPYGVRGSEGCKVLSFIPEKMFSFTWNTPPSLENLRNSGYHTWVVITFAENNCKTEIELKHLGWPEAEEWDKAFEYFDNAWDYVLNSLTDNLTR